MTKSYLTNIFVATSAIGLLFATSSEALMRSDCASIGDRCADGTVYAGRDSSSGARIFTTASDRLVQLPWNAGIRTYAVVGAASERDGKLNSGVLTVSTNPASLSQAAKYCSELHSNGRNDWYLPALKELQMLYDHREKIGGFDERTNTKYWTSSEYTQIFAWVVNFDTGRQENETKSSVFSVRCIRNDAKPGSA